MRVLIVPGFSSHNEIWCKETQEALGQNAGYYRWQHWGTSDINPDWQEEEVEKLIEKLKEPTNVITKSIGTMVVMRLISKRPDLVNKIILCGIPVNDFSDGDETYYHPLEHFPIERLLVIQNYADPHGSFKQAEELVHGFNEGIKIIETPRDDHEYPFTEEFKKFFAS